MPCPYFEPQAVAAAPQHASARLPLLDEYDGVCRAHPEPIPAPAERRFRCCNHGYSYNLCDLFPAASSQSCFRYTVLRESSDGLDILCVEERNYAPVRWHPAHYRFESAALEPELADACMRAQALAFCRSYLQRFRPAS